MESIPTTAIAIVAGPAFSRGHTARASVLWHVSSIEIAKAGFGSQILAGAGKSLKQKDTPNHIPTALVALNGVVARRDVGNGRSFVRMETLRPNEPQDRHGA